MPRGWGFQQLPDSPPFSDKHSTDSRLLSLGGLRRLNLSIGSLLLLLLALHTVGAGRREESTATFLASAVASILATDRTANAEEQAGDEQADSRGPHKSESLDTDFGALAVTIEGIPTLNKDGAIKLLACRTTEKSTGIRLHLRHEASSDGLEGKSQPREEARQVAANARAHGQQASEEGDHGEEQANDDEGEHESGRQEVVVSSAVHSLAMVPQGERSLFYAIELTR